MKTMPLLVVMPLILSGLLLQGCATQTIQSSGAKNVNANSNLSTEEKGIREQGSWFTASDAQGCLAGGVVGGVIGAVIGGDHRNSTAAIGAGVGCAIGIGANKIFQSIRKSFAKKEEVKQELLTQVRNENEKARLYITNANKVIDADLNKIAAIEQDLGRKTISLEKAKQEMQQIDNNIAVMGKTLSGMKSREAQIRAAATKSPSPELDGEIVQYKEQITTYENELNRLVEKRVMTKVS